MRLTTLLIFGFVFLNLAWANNPLATQTWLHMVQNARVNTHWGWRIDAMHQRMDDVDFIQNTRLNFIRLGLAYHFGKWVLVPGYAYFQFFGSQRIIQEHRSYQFLWYSTQISNLPFTCRLRTEQRYLDTDLPGKFTDHRARVGLLAIVQIPFLAKKIEEKKPFIVCTNEVLGIMRTSRLLAVQNIIGLGLGVRVSPFSYQVLLSSLNSTTLPQSTVIRIQVLHTLDFRKKD